MPAIWICIFGMCVAQGEGYAQHIYSQSHIYKTEKHTSTYVYTRISLRIYATETEGNQILYSAFYFLYLRVKSICIITRIYNCI